jgi:membrane protease YdiL (CAAX protease family)
MASLLFGLVHFISRTYAALCFLIGIYLGMIWIITGNLMVPAFVHGLYDFVALAYLVRPDATNRWQSG